MDSREITTLIPRFLIRLYQLLRAGSARRCRFYPSCSEYAAQALETRGLVGGLWHGTLRILKCHPWHTGGYDPVTACRDDNTRRF